MKLERFPGIKEWNIKIGLCPRTDQCIIAAAPDEDDDDKGSCYRVG